MLNLSKMPSVLWTVNLTGNLIILNHLEASCHQTGTTRPWALSLQSQAHHDWVHPRAQSFRTCLPGWDFFGCQCTEGLKWVQPCSKPVKEQNTSDIVPFTQWYLSKRNSEIHLTLLGLKLQLCCNLSPVLIWFVLNAEGKSKRVTFARVCSAFEAFENQHSWEQHRQAPVLSLAPVCEQLRIQRILWTPPTSVFPSQFWDSNL